MLLFPVKRFATALPGVSPNNGRGGERASNDDVVGSVCRELGELAVDQSTGSRDGDSEEG